MKKIALLLSVALCMLAQSANATTFEWTLFGTQEVSQGTITATLVNGSQYAVTSITGLFDGNTITGLLPVNTLDIPYGDDNDNLIYSPASPYDNVDANGLGFTTSSPAAGTYGGNVYISLCSPAQNCYYSGEDTANVFYNNNGTELYTQLTSQFSLTVDTTATPLPAALPLFASGLGALGLLGWRRKKKAAAY